MVSTGVIEFINESSLSKELANYYEMRYVRGKGSMELYLELKVCYESSQNINLVDDKIDFNNFNKSYIIQLQTINSQ